MISYAKISFSRKKKKIHKTYGKPLKLLQISFDKAEIFRRKLENSRHSGSFCDRTNRISLMISHIFSNNLGTK